MRSDGYLVMSGAKGRWLLVWRDRWLELLGGRVS